MNIVRALVAGAIGGLVGAAAMGPAHAMAADIDGAKPAKGEDATERVANAIAITATGHTLQRSDKKTGGQIVHFAFGAAVGALYGLLASQFPVVSSGGGTVFGAGVYVGAHLVAVPALGLAPGAEENGAARETAELAAHLVYGATTERIRKALS